MMAIWKSWYRGNVNDFHYFTMKMADGVEKQCERLTMNIPKKVCEDFAKLLWSEKVQIKLDKKKNTERLLEVLDSKENNFKVNFPDFLERVFALGTGVTVEYKKNGKSLIDYIDGDVVIPYKYTNSYINGLITVSRFTKGVDLKKKYYTHITYHEFTGDKYTKLNELYVSKNETTLGKEIPFNDMFPGVSEFEEFETDNPHFQVWKPVIANNFDTDSPMGISILANQIDKFKAIDTKYDSFNREFRTGKKRVLIDRTAVKKKTEVDADGKVNYVSYFDNNDEVYVPDTFRILLIGSAKTVSGSAAGLIALTTPLKVYDLVNTLQMIETSMKKQRQNRKKARKRTEQEENYIKNAKRILMERNHLTEEEAYRYLQKTSMDTGTNMVETAQMVITLIYDR